MLTYKWDRQRESERGRGSEREGERARKGQREETEKSSSFSPNTWFKYEILSVNNKLDVVLNYGPYCFQD